MDSGQLLELVVVLPGEAAERVDNAFLGGHGTDFSSLRLATSKSIVESATV